MVCNALYPLRQDSPRSLEIPRFPLLAPRKLLEAQKFNIRYTEPSQITEIADKLPWYRYQHQHVPMQKEMAAHIGISRTTYIHNEEYSRALP